METKNFNNRVKEALEARVIIADGHTLFSPEFYSPHFSAEELREAGLIQVHESDGTAKGSIFDNEGNLVEKLEAVYNLSFLYWVTAKMGITKYPRSSGRGFQAQELVDFIREDLEKN